MNVRERRDDMEREDLTAWMNICDIEGLDAKKASWAFLTVHRHKSPVTTLERHLRTAEAFIPLEGQSVMVVAPPSDVNNVDAKPDEAMIRAFYLDGSAGIFFPKGAWHWAPFAVSESASFLLLVNGDVGDDIDEKKVGPIALRLY